MKREIKFRAISELSEKDMNFYSIKHKGKWAIGIYNDGFMIGKTADADDDYYTPEWWCSIKPETVGQYTGLHDSNGKEIYEGDVIDWLFSHDTLRGIVQWLPGSAMFDVSGSRIDYVARLGKVIGNVHENPELMEATHDGN